VTVEADSLIEAGEVKVEGIALPVPSGGGRPLVHDGRSTWARLDLEALRQRLPYPILPIYLRQLPDSSLPSFPRRLAPLSLDEGPHLSYAVQWFLFAGLAVLFAVLVVARSR
jgi:surfeit locus 1 family protein